MERAKKAPKRRDSEGRFERQLQAARRECGSWADVADALGVSEKSARRWLRRESRPRPQHVHRLELVVRAVRAGASVFALAGVPNRELEQNLAAAARGEDVTWL